MTVRELIGKQEFEVLCEGEHMDQKIKCPFCCDLLSIAMTRAIAGCAWVTVMANVNTLAVASLVEAACVVLAEEVRLDEASIEAAKKHGITVLASKTGIYDTAKKIDGWLNEEDPV